MLPLRIRFFSNIYKLLCTGMGPCLGWALGRRTLRHGPGPALTIYVKYFEPSLM